MYRMCVVCECALYPCKHFLRMTCSITYYKSSQITKWNEIWWLLTASKIGRMLILNDTRSSSIYTEGLLLKFSRKLQTESRHNADTLILQRANGKFNKTKKKQEKTACVHAQKRKRRRVWVREFAPDVFVISKLHTTKLALIPVWWC